MRTVKSYSCRRRRRSCITQETRVRLSPVLTVRTSGNRDNPVLRADLQIDWSCMLTETIKPFKFNCWSHHQHGNIKEGWAGKWLQSEGLVPQRLMETETGTSQSETGFKAVRLWLEVLTRKHNFISTNGLDCCLSQSQERRPTSHTNKGVFFPLLAVFVTCSVFVLS